MIRGLERRVGGLEAQTTRRVAVIPLYAGETNDEARAPHLVAHPDDRSPELRVFIRHFFVGRPQ